MLREQLIQALHKLTPREEKVIRLRYGLDDGKQKNSRRSRARIQRNQRAYKTNRSQSVTQTPQSYEVKKLRDYLD